jgi:transposase-like protein
MDTTVQELDVTDKTLWERWDSVKDDFWGDLKTQTVRALQRLLETTMDIEMQDLVGARRWVRERIPGRQRNGFSYRSLLTGFGYIPKLAVPRLRSGCVRWKCLPAYKRRTADVDTAILKIFLAGVSTRRVEEVLEPLLGSGTLSSSTVSEISRVLDAAVKQFHRRPLQDVYRYLLLDGVYLKAKSPASVKRRCILVLYGIRQDGIRELIDFQLAPHGESQVAWEVFLTRLKDRGLNGKEAHLAILDGNKGSWNALDLVFPGLPRQRCWAHKLRNVINHVPRKLQKPCCSAAAKIYCASSYGKALKAFKRWKAVWKPIVPEAVKCLELDLEALLVFYRVVPKELWVKVRTTNIIERIFREVRRRTRPMSCFQNTESVERIIYAIFYRQNVLWMDDPLLEITQKS